MLWLLRITICAINQRLYLVITITHDGVGRESLLRIRRLIIGKAIWLTSSVLGLSSGRSFAAQLRHRCGILYCSLNYFFKIAHFRIFLLILNSKYCSSHNQRNLIKTTYSPKPALKMNGRRRQFDLERWLRHSQIISST